MAEPIFPESEGPVLFAALPNIFVGTGFGEFMFGTPDMDILDALGGDDVVIADDSADLVLAGNGDDTVLGDGGNDLIFGGRGNDLLLGGEGWDRIKGNTGHDVILGEGGNDTLKGLAGRDTIVGGAGDDVIEGGYGSDLLDGDIGNDTLVGERGNDFLFGWFGNDVLLGQIGDDTLQGGTGEDYLDGGQDRDRLFGGRGNDTLIGGAGHDNLSGGRNDDVLNGDAGQDVLAGGMGNDLIDGGDNADTALYGGSILDYAFIVAPDGSVTITDLNPTDGDDGTDLLTNVEFLRFTDYTYAVGGNNAPIVTANDVTVTTDEDTSTTTTFTVYDPDGTALPTVQSLTSTLAALGTVTPVADVVPQGVGATYTVEVDPSGLNDALNVGVTNSQATVVTFVDGDGNTASDTFTLEVTGVNDDPVAADTVLNATELDFLGATPPGVDVIALLTDVDGGATPSVTLASALNGTAFIDGDFVRYTPGDTFTGSDTISYTASDGAGGSDTGEIVVTVTQVNGLIPLGDTFSTQEDQVTELDVYANDVNLTGNPFTVNFVSDPANGTVDIINGRVTYSPDLNFNGTDTFTYTITDGAFTSSAVTVSVAVTPVNDAPTITGSGLTVNEADGPTSFDLTTQVTDLEGDALTFSNIEVDGIHLPFPLTVTDEANGLISIDAESLGLDTGETFSSFLTFEVSDGTAPAVTGVIPVTINGEDEPFVPNTPVTAIAGYTTSFTEGDGGVEIPLLSILSDPDQADTLTITALSYTSATGGSGNFTAFSGGSGIVSENPTLFLPETQSPFLLLDILLADNASEVVTFNYTGNDGSGSVSGTFTVEYTNLAEPTNAAPTATSQSYIVDDIVVPAFVFQTDGSLGATLVIDLDTLVADTDNNGLNPGDPGYQTLTITSTDGFVTGTDEATGDPITFGSFNAADNTITVTYADLGLADGESIEGVVTYSVSDGIDSTSGTLRYQFEDPLDTPPPTGPQTYTWDFEEFSFDNGATGPILEIDGFTFGGNASVMETDELGGRSALPGLIPGQTTSGGSNILIGSRIITQEEVLVEDPPGSGIFVPLKDGEGNSVFQDVLGAQFSVSSPDLNASFLSSPFSQGFLQAGLTFAEVQELVTGLGTNFDLEGLSLGLVDGTGVTVTITPYRFDNFTETPQFATFSTYTATLTAVDDFEFVLNAGDAPQVLDFNDAAFADADPNFASAFDDIVFFEITVSDNSGITLDDLILIY